MGNFCRTNDLSARYEGDAFTLLLPETGALGAEILAKRVAATIEKEQFQHGANVFQISVSIGGIEWQRDGGTLDDQLDRLEKALAFAKRKGKGSVYCAPAPTDEE